MREGIDDLAFATLGTLAVGGEDIEAGRGVEYVFG